MLEFHVTEEIFNLVKSGNKFHEYREYNPYWIKRLSNLLPPLMANIVKGYSNEKIPIIVMKINVIETNMIDTPFYRDFINTIHCYDIQYEIKEDKL